MASICAVGSAVLDRVFVLSNLPEPDGGAFVRDRERRGGGVAANVACALSALDHDTAVTSRVGDDDAAEEIVGSLRSGASTSRGSGGATASRRTRSSSGGPTVAG